MLDWFLFPMVVSQWVFGLLWSVFLWVLVVWGVWVGLKRLFTYLKDNRHSYRLSLLLKSKSKEMDIDEYYK